MCFGAGRSNRRDKLAVRHLLLTWHGRLQDEKNSVGAGWYSGADTLGQSAEIVGETCCLHRFVWALAQVAVFKYFTGGSVKYRVGFIGDILALRAQWRR